MATFFVGQRVRVTRSDFHPELVGYEAQIIREELLDSDEIWVLSGARYEDFYVEKRNASACLEPILPEGHAPSTYSFQELMDKCRSWVAA